MACGMAIILLASLTILETKDEWALIIRLLHNAAQHGSGRKIVLDGIASCIEMSVPEDNRGFDSYGKLLCIEMLLNHLSCGDISHCYLAMNLLQSLFFTLGRNSGDLIWLNVALSYYQTSFSSNSAISQHAIECLQKHIVAIHSPADLSEDVWLQLYQQMIIDRPPSLTRSKVRTTCLIILTRSLLLSFSTCSSPNKMVPVIEGLVSMARENISGRHDGLLFESTVQHVTNMINVTELLLQAREDNDSSMADFLEWTVESFRTELEKVGRTGGCILRSSNRVTSNNDLQTSLDQEQVYDHELLTTSGEPSSEQISMNAYSMPFG